VDIDLGDDGVTLNTSGGPHAGPNNLQNYPTITSAYPFDINLGGTLIDGTLNSAANSTYTLDFYANTLPGPLSFGGGQRWLGSLTGVSTDSNGNAVFAATLP